MRPELRGESGAPPRSRARAQTTRFSSRPVYSSVQACRRQSHSLTAHSAASSGPCPAPRRAPNARRVRKAPTVRRPSQPPTSATTISHATRLVLARPGESHPRRTPRCRPALRQVSPLPFSLPNLRGGGETQTSLAFKEAAARWRGVVVVFSSTKDTSLPPATAYSALERASEKRVQTTDAVRFVHGGS